MFKRKTMKKIMKKTIITLTAIALPAACGQGRTNVIEN
jgi:hypothetical protein